jgi:outer membrane immunogenic protein
MKHPVHVVAFVVNCGSVLGADLPSGRLGVHPQSVLLSHPRDANWIGFYAGALFGAGMGDVKDASLSPITNADRSPVKGNLHRTGALGGFQAGYGFMAGPVQMGVEADLALTNISGVQSASGTYNLAPASARLKAKTDMLGSLRGRVGYVVDGSLFYVTGGMASALQKSTFTVTEYGLGSSVTRSGASYGLRLGWVVGLGVERFLTREVSGKLEYLYANVGDGIRGRADPNGVHLLRGGVNYHF